MGFQKSGDSHRFGQKILFNESDPFVIKPRNTLLEELFLGKQSPLRVYEKILGLNLSAEIISDSLWSGKCENLLPYEVSEDELLINKKLFSRLAGKCTAMATLLGLNDLHHENILFIKRGGVYSIVPIDIEIIFYRFVSAAETCLFPSLKSDRSQCGFKRLMPLLDEELILNLIDAFVISWDEILSIKMELFDLIEKRIKDIPVRMIFRPTRSYFHYLQDKNREHFKRDPLELTNEEELQLRAGDIPYFFSYFSDPSTILFFDSPLTTNPAQNLMKHPSYGRHLNLQKTLSDEKMLNTLFQNSLAHLVYHLHYEQGSSLDLDLKGEQFSASKKNETITITTQLMKYHVKV